MDFLFRYKLPLRIYFSILLKEHQCSHRCNQALRPHGKHYLNFETLVWKKVFAILPFENHLNQSIRSQPNCQTSLKEVSQSCEPTFCFVLSISTLQLAKSFALFGSAFCLSSAHPQNIETLCQSGFFRPKCRAGINIHCFQVLPSLLELSPN